MKSICGLWIARAIPVAALLSLMLFSLFTTSCGERGSSAPPITLPAPTGGYINGTAPDSSGNSIIYGFIFDGSEFLAEVIVVVTNKENGETESTSADTDGFFSATIPASVGDEIGVKYIDPATNGQSEETIITITNDTQILTSSADMEALNMALGAGGVAYVVANDGTNSEIIAVDLATGLISDNASFSGKTFDKIAVHSGLDYAAVLDTANAMLYWYDLSDLSDDMAETSSGSISTTPVDVAVVDLDDAAAVTSDMVIVSHAVNVWDGIFSIYAIGTGTPPTLATPTVDNCIVHPSDANYPNCTGANTYEPSEATAISMIESTNNRAHLGIVVEYDDSGTTARAAHFLYFVQAGTNVSIDYTVGSYFSGALDDGVIPYDLIWYNGSTALMTDSDNGNLLMLENDGADIDITALAVGSDPKGMAVDPDQNQAFVASQGEENVLIVNMTNFELSGTSYRMMVNPTDVAFYTDGTVGRIGAVITYPRSLFKTVDTTE